MTGQRGVPPEEYEAVDENLNWCLMFASWNLRKVLTDASTSGGSLREGHLEAARLMVDIIEVCKKPPEADALTLLTMEKIKASYEKEDSWTEHPNTTAESSLDVSKSTISTRDTET